MTASQSIILLKNIVIVDPQSPWHMQAAEIRIEAGRISAIGQSLDGTDAYIIDGGGFYAGGGWCDIGAYCGEPGDEVHETLDSLQAAARRGGYTRVALFSNDTRPFDNRHIVRDIAAEQSGSPLLTPIGAVSKDMAGEEMCELLDIAQSAPPLFTDGFHQNAANDLIYKALEYSKQCNGRIACIPGALSSLKKGHVNESIVSAQMGLPGLPGFEEVAKLAGLLSIVSYAQGRFLAHLLSHAESVEQVQFRKEQGLDVMASVAAMQLLHTEDAVKGFDENFKVLPPLRSATDRDALQAGLRDGSIDFVCSNHRPIIIEQKSREFGESPFGAIGLETCYFNLATAMPDITAENVCAWLSDGPRRSLDLPPIHITEGAPAEITLFSLSGETTYMSKNSASLSRNTPYLNETFKGEIGGSIHGTHIYQNKS